MKQKTPKAADVYVGQRIRSRRIAIGMSQETLGKNVGITFQQVQKYEKGINRCGGSRLVEFAAILGVPASYFFDGMPGVDAEVSADDATMNQFCSTRDGRRLATAFMSVTGNNVRRSIIDLVENIAGKEAA